MQERSRQEIKDDGYTTGTDLAFEITGRKRKLNITLVLRLVMLYIAVWLVKKPALLAFVIFRGSRRLISGQLRALVKRSVERRIHTYEKRQGKK